MTALGTSTALMSATRSVTSSPKSPGNARSGRNCCVIECPTPTSRGFLWPNKLNMETSYEKLGHDINGVRSRLCIEGNLTGGQRPYVQSLLPHSRRGKSEGTGTYPQRGQHQASDTAMQLCPAEGPKPYVHPQPRQDVSDLQQNQSL